MKSSSIMDVLCIVVTVLSSCLAGRLQHTSPSRDAQRIAHMPCCPIMVVLKPARPRMLLIADLLSMGRHLSKANLGHDARRLHAEGAEPRLVHLFRRHTNAARVRQMMAGRAREHELALHQWQVADTPCDGVHGVGLVACRLHWRSSHWTAKWLHDLVEAELCRSRRSIRTHRGKTSKALWPGGRRSAVHTLRSTACRLSGGCRLSVLISPLDRFSKCCTGVTPAIV